jgi:hypothetical protein
MVVLITMRERAESKYCLYDIVNNGVVHMPSDGERTEATVTIGLVHTESKYYLYDIVNT